MHSKNELHEKIEFLTKDFLTLSDKLTEQYHPSNLSSLANIGSVLTTMLHLEDKKEHIHPHKESAHIPSPSSSLLTSLSTGLEPQQPHNPHHILNYDFERMEEELKDAQGYYEKWRETGDAHFRQLSKEELGHADFFIKRVKESGKIDSIKMKVFIDKYNDLCEVVK